MFGGLVFEVMVIISCVVLVCVSWYIKVVDSGFRLCVLLIISSRLLVLLVRELCVVCSSVVGCLMLVLEVGRLIKWWKVLNGMVCFGVVFII